MKPYEYKSLAPGEIRLLTLHPDVKTSPIRLSLDNTQLRSSKTSTATARISLKELQSTLPAGWTVWETLGERIIFYHAGSTRTSWTHPTEGFDKALCSEVVEVPGLLPSFEALSYTWGVEDDCIEVQVIEQQDPLAGSRGTLQIRPNLDAALRHLRYIDRPRKIWIDAVCINQNDMRERSEQVQCMTDIYRGATRVVVWLGTASNNSSLALSTLKFLGQQLEMTRDNFFYPHPEAVRPDWHHIKNELPYSSTIWAAFEDLFQRQWFERLWIWQEAHLARKESIVQCGNDTIEWPTFRRTVRRLYWAAGRSSSQLSPSFISRIDHIDNLVSNHTGISFNRWIAVTKQALCTNSKDRVYGLLGLAPPEYAKALEPDYSLSVGEVYKSAVVAGLATTNALTLLCHCDPQQRSFDGPSWVPDWSMEKRTRTTGFDFAFLASGRSGSYAKYVPPSKLVVQGVLYGTVESVTVPYREDQGLHILLDWAPHQVHHDMYVNGESLLDAYLSTLWGGEVRNYTGYSHHPTLADLDCAFPTRKDLLTLVTGTTASTTDCAISKPSRWIPGRVFAMTTKGYIGLVPCGTRTGDVVCVLLGCPLPMVLRSSSEGGYEVIGSAYVHGLMNGEGILGALPSDWVKKPARTEANFDIEGFCNRETDKLTFDDPRLESLPKEWKIDAESTISLRRIAEPKFVNQLTGEIRKTDPRLTPEAIRRRGMKLEPITLV